MTKLSYERARSAAAWKASSSIVVWRDLCHCWRRLNSKFAASGVTWCRLSHRQRMTTVASQNSTYPRNANSGGWQGALWLYNVAVTCCSVVRVLLLSTSSLRLNLRGLYVGTIQRISGCNSMTSLKRAERPGSVDLRQLLTTNWIELPCSNSRLSRTERSWCF